MKLRKRVQRFNRWEDEQRLDPSSEWVNSRSMVVAENLHKLYDGGDGLIVGAIKGVSLTIVAGEFVAIVGPSGSGKSTLLNLLGAIDTPTSGSLQIDGVDLASTSGDRLADFRRDTVGFVFQLFNLIPVLSALDNVKLPLVPYARRGADLDKRARKVLYDVGLATRMYHLPNHLSGGEQQRVAVARALINQPKLLLADEPTGNLDSKSGNELMDLFSSLHRDHGVTVVMVTHDTSMASYAQRIVKLHDGFVVD